MTKLTSVGVIGAGTTGRSIIWALAASGIWVRFCEISQARVDQAIEDIALGLDREIRRWGLTPGEKRLILSRIKGSVNLEDLIGCQVIIEAVPGDVSQKQALFHRIDSMMPAETLLVSNSPTVNVSDLAREVAHPERVMGMHFSYPVPARVIVEIVRGRETSDAAMDLARTLAKRMKKTPIEVFEMPGQITTRVMMPYINEAVQIIMEGLATVEQVDQAVRLSMKVPIGPLEMADQLGLDSVLFTMDRLFRELGDMRYRPCPLIRRMVREGALGLKVGRGFFRYDKEGNMIKGSGIRW